jgi:hypothetical protein
MSPFMISFVSSLVASLGGGLAAATALAAWLGSVWKERIARVEAALIQVDIDLRLRRIEVYQPLWELTALLPRWPRDPHVTYEDLFKFSEDLRKWYFSGGGMYLSRTTHQKGYYPLQQELERVLSQTKAGELSQLSHDDYGSVRDCCSSLRSHLAEDIASRRDSFNGQTPPNMPNIKIQRAGRRNG